MDIQEVFNVALEKMMNLDISTVFWSNIMDLLAILTKSNILEVTNFKLNFYRFSVARCIELVINLRKYFK